MVDCWLGVPGFLSILITTVLAAALVNNLLFIQLLGVSSLFFYTHRLKNTIEFCGLASTLLFIASIVNLLLYRWVLTPLNAEFLSLLLFVSVSASIGLGISTTIRKLYPLLAFRQDLTISLFSVSSTVIGAALINTTSLLSTPELIAYCFGSAAGFGATMSAFAALRQRIDHAEVPPVMRGTPLDLISAGIIAMAFLGFAGLV